MLGLSMGLWNSAATAVAGGGPGFPASLGANLVLNLTDLSAANCYTDTGATTHVASDGDLCKAIKDPTSGIIFTNATGWAWHPNSGKPKLTMAGGSNLFNSSSFTFADANGQYACWITAMVSSASPWVLEFNHTYNMLLMNGGASSPNGISSSFAISSTNTTMASDNGPPAIQQGIPYVVSTQMLGASGTGTIESFVDNISSGGSTAWTGTPKTADVITIGDSTPGDFYGLVIAKGDQSANRAVAQTFMAALHP